jgi:hypothetical protein
LDTASNINLGGNIRTEVKPYQFAGFASYNQASWFSDFLVSEWAEQLRISVGQVSSEI